MKRNDIVLLADYEILPFLQIPSTEKMNGRSVVLSTFHDGEKWILPMITNEGKIILIPNTIPHKGKYLAKSIQNHNTDFPFQFLDFLYKHASWHEIIIQSDSIVNDVFNLFTSVAKIDLFYEYSEQNSDCSDYVTTEIEYILINCKSLFDYLQKVISIIWNKYIKLNEGIKYNLPDTFRKMVYLDKKKLTTEQIISKFGLPDAIANFYSDTAIFYENLKIFRDDIVHHGKNIEVLFVLKEGFAARKESILFNYFPVYNENESKPNNLYSIRPLIHHIIRNTIISCNYFSEIIRKCIQFPENIMPEYSTFLRIPQFQSFMKMEKELMTNSWWK